MIGREGKTAGGTRRWRVGQKLFTEEDLIGSNFDYLSDSELYSKWSDYGVLLCFFHSLCFSLHLASVNSQHKSAAAVTAAIHFQADIFTASSPQEHYTCFYS